MLQRTPYCHITPEGRLANRSQAWARAISSGGSARSPFLASRCWQGPAGATLRPSGLARGEHSISQKASTAPKPTSDAGLSPEQLTALKSFFELDGVATDEAWFRGLFSTTATRDRWAWLGDVAIDYHAKRLILSRLRGSTPGGALPLVDSGQLSKMTEAYNTNAVLAEVARHMGVDRLCPQGVTPGSKAHRWRLATCLEALVGLADDAGGPAASERVVHSIMQLVDKLPPAADA